MIMHIVRITLEKLVKEHIKREPASVLEKNIVTLQIRFIVQAIVNNPFSAQTLQ
jgi:hypothetical protein